MRPRSSRSMRCQRSPTRTGFPPWLAAPRARSYRDRRWHVSGKGLHTQDLPMIGMSALTNLFEYVARGKPNL
eukprot:2638521-Heterocapsa_arctica.AAC.1